MTGRGWPLNFWIFKFKFWKRSQMTPKTREKVKVSFAVVDHCKTDLKLHHWWYVMSKRPFDYTKYGRRRYTLHKLLHSRKSPKSLRLHKITQVLGLILGRFTAFLGLFTAKKCVFNAFQKNWILSEPVYHEKFCQGQRDFHEVVKIGSQSIDFYGPKISSGFKNSKAEISTKITWITSFLCNDYQNFSTQYTKLHITQEHVFMTHQHWFSELQKMVI